ncbi:LacI family DNA-binding transcriptional regulator [Pedobacter vanadiisoli]|uniref:LacI family DNA-binding transcriptional regulator n=1 Tax=Pedobacter vanadiisoli TaxID=1761975 RepID=A0ABW5MNN8_9SPHI
MKPSVTLKKISNMLNISISTVSRALKNHPDISEATRNKVQELAGMLDYVPNAHAISLRTNNSKEFGIIVPSISSYFYHSFISSIEEEARRFGYSLVILQSGEDPKIELENVIKCKNARLSGIFISITSETEDISELLKLDQQNIPTIFFDKVPAYEACNKVCTADTGATRLVADLLIKKKKKKILAMFGNQHLSITQVRVQAFKEFMEQHNWGKKFEIVYAHSPAQASEQLHLAFQKKNKPDAVFCMSDEILTGVMKRVQMLKIQVPEELGIIAISDGSVPQLYYPEITYAETSGFKLGKLAFSRMMTCIAGTPFVQSIVDESVLIFGGSI